MVNATIDNNPVSIQLGDSESTTVPSNETWKVTVSTISRGLDSESANPGLKVNGKVVIGQVGDATNGGAITSAVGEFVFTGGDVLEADSGFANGVEVGIQGFVVNS